MRVRRLVSLLVLAAAASLTIGAVPGVDVTATDPAGCEIELGPVQTANPLPVGTGSCPGVRPGAYVGFKGGYCTMNFLFRGERYDQQQKRWVHDADYIGTAGHCIIGDGKEQVWARGTGPRANERSGERIGEFAFASQVGPRDFALIRLDAGVKANPAMCHFGGPTGMNRATTYDPVVLHHFGQGLGFGSTVPGRTHVAASMPNHDHVYAEGAAIFGDSGSAVISSDGRAVGALVTIGVHYGGAGIASGQPWADAGVVGITRIGPQIDRAAQQMGLRFHLKTAPLAD